MPLTRPIRGCAGRFFAARSSEGAASQRPYEGKSKKAKAKAKAKGEGKGMTQRQLQRSLIAASRWRYSTGNVYSMG